MLFESLNEAYPTVSKLTYLMEYRTQPHFSQIQGKVFSVFKYILLTANQQHITQAENMAA